MQLANPIYFLLLIFIALFIVFYFFRKQYTKQIIPSNLLWEEVLKEIKASSWLNRWQNNALFWLQLFCLLLLMLALVGPFIEKDSVKGEQIILLFDTSASMSANGIHTNRLEESKEKALDMLKNKQVNQTVTIIEVSDSPEIILSSEQDINKINNVIAKMEVSYTHEDWQSATELTSSIAKEGKSSIHLFSDSVTKENMVNLQDFYVEVHNEHKEKEENVTILSFGVSPGKDKVIGAAMIENQTDSDQLIPFIVESEGTELYKQELQLRPNEKKLVQIQDLPAKAYYSAKVDSDDKYQVDNIQTAILQKQNTTLYTNQNMNPFILKGFEAIGLQVVQMENNEDFIHKEDGIILLSGETIPDNMEQPFIFYYEGENKQELTSALEKTDDQLFQHVDMQEVFIASANNRSEEGLETILKSGDMALIQKGIINNQPSVLIHFDMKDSDWPLHASFPIFQYNMYQWITTQTSYLGEFKPLETRTVTINSSNDEWDIYNEQNELITTFSLENEGFQTPNYPGVYQLVSDDEILYFSVNLEDKEKNISSEKSFILNKDKLQSTVVSKTQNDWIWYLFCSLALIILCIEWEVYRRADRV